MLRGLVAAVVVGALLLPAGCGDGAGGRALVPEGEPRVTQDAGGGVTVVGEVRNTSTERPYTGTLQVTLKDAQGRIVGSAVGAVNDVPPGGTLPYTAIGQTPTAPWARVEVAVTAQLPR